MINIPKVKINSTRKADFTFLLNQLYNFVDVLEIDNHNYTTLAPVKDSVKHRIDMTNINFDLQHEFLKIAGLNDTLRLFNAKYLKNKKIKSYLDNIFKDMTSKHVSKKKHFNMIKDIKLNIQQSLKVINPEYNYEVKKSMH